MKRSVAIAALSIFTACAPRCGSEDRAEKPRAPGRWYRVLVKASPYEIPFFLWLPPNDSKEPALIANGEERISIDHAWRGERSELSFPVFHATIDSQISDSGELRGEWEMGHIGNTSFGVVGQAIEGPDPLLRFERTSTAAVDVAGVWRIEWERFGVSKGILRQEPNGVVTGTALLERVADLRFMAGVVDGRELLMSTFDGQHAYLLRAEVEPDGKTMSGVFVWPPLIEETFTAVRADDVPIDFLNQTKLKPGQTKLTMKELEKHRGKAVLVDLFGTWCPACIDMTPFLSEMRQKYGREGLEIISIAIELTDDAEYAKTQVARFREKYRVDWEIVVIVGEEEKVPQQLPPELDEVKGLPSTVFVRRDGTVHAIHTGFAGPATGEDHRKVREEFERLIRETLAR